MKKMLPEYFPPTEDDIKRIWQSGTIVIDANVLLNIFRYSKNSREELIKILQHYKDRIWIPYQVAFEFLANSLSVPAGINKILSETLKKVDDISGLLEERLSINKFDKFHLLKPEELRKEINSFQKKLHNKVEKIKKEYDKVDKEAIVEQISILLEGKVGEDIDEEELEKIYKEGERRYKEKIPPGYKDIEDKKNETKRHLYGDLIWWKQTIEYAKKNHCDIVIVTDDAKEDWWYKINNETKRPRMELVKEFSELSGQTFHMYRTSRFMELAKRYDKVSISKTSIQEVKSIGTIDNAKYGNLNMSIWDMPLNISDSLYGTTNYEDRFRFPHLDAPNSMFRENPLLNVSDMSYLSINPQLEMSNQKNFFSIKQPKEKFDYLSSKEKTDKNNKK